MQLTMITFYFPYSWGEDCPIPNVVVKVRQRLKNSLDFNPVKTLSWPFSLSLMLFGISPYDPDEYQSLPVLSWLLPDSLKTFNFSVLTK